MERTTRAKRKQYAREFYQLLCGGGVQKAAIVIQRQDSKTNPNIHRCQFITAHVNGPSSNVVIAESVDGITGCFYELVQSIQGNIPQKGYFEDGFQNWFRRTMHMRITWNDGLVIMVEYARR